ncbi:MAG: hypothetical protein PHU23_08720 [Dehalococcoidales bacterium]|nr:hypothetical protein [Dehalococcoidales bacterium]
MGQSNKIVITFSDLPYVELRANYHKSNFWGQRSESTKIARDEAYKLAVDYRNKYLVRKKIDTCTIEEVFYVDNKQRRDIEGLMYAVKPWIDGIVDAGIIVDDSWRHVKKLSGEIVFKKGERYTEIIIKEVL